MNLKDNYGFNDFCEIIKKLRGPDGCPWDKEQTHTSIRQGMIEESYEVIEAINKDDKDLLCEELGDVLLQVVFHSEIEREAGVFDITHVINGISRKMIRRHPHVFGDVKVSGSSEVLRNWDDIKKEEKGAKTQSDMIKNIPMELPALIRCLKVQQKAAKEQKASRALKNEDNPSTWQEEGNSSILQEDVSASVRVNDNLGEVIAETRKLLDFLENLTNKDMLTGIPAESKPAGTSDEKSLVSEPLLSPENKNLIGSLLFSGVNLARILKIYPEIALNEKTDEFIKAFERKTTETSGNNGDVERR